MAHVCLFLWLLAGEVMLELKVASNTLAGAGVGQLKARKPQPLWLGGRLLLLPMYVWRWRRGWREQRGGGGRPWLLEH
jgi:hypothetical protein